MKGTYLADGMEGSTIVDPQLVHLRGPGRVLLASVSRAANDTFLVAVRWPLASSIYGVDQFGCHDTMLIPETLRQAGIAVAHIGYGVPFDDQFIMAEMNFRIIDQRLLTVLDTESDLVAGVTFTDLRTRRGRFRSAVVCLSLERHGSPMAQGSATLVCVPATTYGRLRGRATLQDDGGRVATLAKLDPGTVGRSDTNDVLLCEPAPGAISSTRGTWPLRVDPSHPKMFDHRVDHVPGMVQLEALRQAALTLSRSRRHGLSSRFGGCRVAFHRLVELDQPIWAHAETTGPNLIRVELRQGDTMPRSEGTILVQHGFDDHASRPEGSTGIPSTTRPEDRPGRGLP